MKHTTFGALIHGVELSPPAVRYSLKANESNSLPVQLVAENLAIERGERTVVRDLSFSLQSGEVLVLAGANGAGKTTLLRAIGGFLPLAGGTLRLDPEDHERTLAEIAHSIGHANAVKANLTVKENCLFWAEFLSGSAGAGARADAALGAFALSDLADYPASYLSAGQKRRLGLSRLLAAPRSIWLLDEPSVSLDTQSTALLAKAINAHTRAGGMAVVATHLPLDIERARTMRLERGGAVS